MDELKITMLHVDEGENENEIQREKLSHWISAHYSYAVFKTVTGKASSEPKIYEKYHSALTGYKNPLHIMITGLAFWNEITGETGSIKKADEIFS